ncbi:MAG TPA: hypothetical protein DCM28_21370 [Phycisphaerales bacterium]|nr:hypothetical protein [Phycisphaerales bacterium]HCD32029.1 hypothetical protein [Phycisphaerales bacterium]
MLIGCDKTRQAVDGNQGTHRTLPQDPNLPNISDPRFRPRLPAAPKAVRNQNPVTLRVSRLDYELKQSLNQALKYAVDATKPQQTALLKDNGLKLVLLPISEFDGFAKALGDPLNIWRTNLHMAYDGTPLSMSPQIKQSVSVDIHDPQNPITYKTDEGWFRLMLTVQESKLGSASINIIPQHYQPKTSVKPRSKWDKMWDGTLFDMLKTTVVIPNTHLLILCRTNRPTLEEYRVTHQPGLFDPEPGQDATVKENHSMGDLLLTYDHWNHPTQMIYVIARANRGL